MTGVLVDNEYSAPMDVSATADDNSVALPRPAKRLINARGTATDAALNDATDCSDDDNELTWRFEVMDRGKRYILRRGSGDLRESFPGGNFDELPQGRQESYYENSELQRGQKQRAQSRRAAARQKPGRAA